MKISEKKPELLLIALALVMSVAAMLYSVFDSPKYNPVEASFTVAKTTQNGNDSVTDDGKININTADVEELAQLELIGEKKAQAIIEYREKNGRFRSVDELTNVNGISDAVLDKNIGRITV